MDSDSGKCGYGYDNWFFYQLFFSPGIEHFKCSQQDRLDLFLLN
jgi:hypothetical protein